MRAHVCHLTTAPSQQKTSTSTLFTLLTEEQQKLVKNMLITECDSFANDDDVGCIKDMVMDIKLKDHQPVQKIICQYQDHCMPR